MIPGLDVERIRRWADRRVPVHARDQVRLEIETSDRAVTVVECRAPWRADLGTEWSRLPVAPTVLHQDPRLDAVLVRS